MSNPTFATPSAVEWRDDSIDQGFVYECACGEHYREIRHAATCRKCRNYCVFGYCTHVVDIRTNEVVWGEVPSDEEYEEAKALAEARWQAEREELDLREAMWRQEGELYEAEMQRLRDEAALQASELLEDQHWDIQDRLMKSA